MRQFISLIVLVLIFGCNNQNQSENIRVQQFEEILGNEKSKALTKKVEFFEKFLSENFENLPVEESYEKFLLEIKSKGWDFDNWKFDSLLLDSMDNICENSGLREEIWLRRDSVWFEGDHLCYFYQYMNEEDTFEIANFERTDSGISLFGMKPRFERNLNRDSILEAERNVITFNINGKFVKALEKVMDSDSTIIYYLDAKNASRDISPSLIAHGILYGKPDFSDYFVKRIIVAELF